MTEIAPLSKGAATQDTTQKPVVPEEPRLPRGRETLSVQPNPTPMISAVDTGQPLVDDNAKRLHIAQMRADITGSGNIVDLIV